MSSLSASSNWRESSSSHPSWSFSSAVGLDGGGLAEGERDGSEARQRVGMERE